MYTVDTQKLAGSTLRVALGLMYLAHSIVLKYFTFTLVGTAQYFASIGLPAGLAYVVFAAEAVAGVLLLLNVQTRWVSLGMIPILAGATWAHAANGWVFNAPNGGWEYPVFLIAVSFAVGLLYGPTRVVVGPRVAVSH